MAVTRQRAAEFFESRCIDVTHPIRNLFGTRDLEALPALDRLDVLRRFKQRFMRAGVEPRHAAAHDLAIELAQLEIMAIDVGDLELATRRRLETRRNFGHPLIVEVQTGYCVARARRARLLLKRQHAAC